MPLTYIMLDSTHRDYGPTLLTAMETTTAAKYSYTPVQTIVDAAHDANFKVIPIDVTDGERTGTLAPIARANLGDGVYVDECRNVEDFRRRGLPYVGKTGRYVSRTEAVYSADGTQNRFRIPRDFNPFVASSSVQVFVDRIPQTTGFSVSTAGGAAATNVMMDVKFDTAPVLNAEIKIVSEIREPITDVRYARPEKTQASEGAPFITQTYGSANGRDFQNAVAGADNIAGLAGLPTTGLAVFIIGPQIQVGGNINTLNIALRDGTEAAPNYWFSDYPDHPGTHYNGIVMTPVATNNGDGTWKIPGGLTQDTQVVWLKDPGQAGEAELVQVGSQAECASTPNSYFCANYTIAQDLTAVNIGADPTNRIMQGGGGYRYNTGNATRRWMRFVNEKITLVQNQEGLNPPPFDAMWLGGERRYACRGIQYLASLDVRNNTATYTEGASGEYHCGRLYVQDYLFERGKSGIYTIGQGSPRKQFLDLCFVNITCNDIGGFRTTESNIDGHGIGLQGTDNLIVAGYTGRNNGGDINSYNINGQTSRLNHFSDIDIDGTAEFFDNSTDNDAGMSLGGDGVSTDAKSGEVIRASVLNKNQAYRSAWEDQVVWGDPLTPGDIFCDFTATPKAWQTKRYGFHPKRASPGPISFNVFVRQLKCGAGLLFWMRLESTGTAGTDWIYNGDDAQFVGLAADAKIHSTAYGAQTLAQFQANSDAGNTYDPNSTVVAS